MFEQEQEEQRREFEEYIQEWINQEEWRDDFEKAFLREEYWREFKEKQKERRIKF